MKYFISNRQNTTFFFHMCRTAISFLAPFFTEINFLPQSWERIVLVSCYFADLIIAPISQKLFFLWTINLSSLIGNTKSLDLSATQRGCLTRSYGAYDAIIDRVFNTTYLWPPSFDPEFCADRLDNKNISIIWLRTRKICDYVKCDTDCTVFKT